MGPLIATTGWKRVRWAIKTIFSIENKSLSKLQEAWITIFL